MRTIAGDVDYPAASSDTRRWLSGFGMTRLCGGALQQNPFPFHRRKHVLRSSKMSSALSEAIAPIIALTECPTTTP